MSSCLRFLADVSRRHARWWPVAGTSALVFAGLFLLRRTCASQAGIALSFDDRSSIFSWGDAREFLKEHGIRATFFVDRFDALEDEQLRILRELAADGHEIGSHGFRHQHAVRLLQGGTTVDEYLQMEILPSIGHMERLGFSCRSFAYPHGKSTKETDRALAPHFSMIRKVGPEIYHGRSDGPFIGAQYIDHKHFEKAKLEEIIRRSKNTGSFVSLSAHKIGPLGGSYWCSFETLETLAALAKQHGLPFLTMAELAERRR